MTTISDRQDQIISKVVTDIPSGSLITGGHFILDGAAPKVMNLGTLESFSIAAALFSELSATKQVSLGILLNDIGQVCSADSCEIVDIKSFNRETFGLPAEYVRIMSKHNIPQHQLHIFWEKHMRNRGKKLFHKMKSLYPDKIFTVDRDTYFRLSTEETAILLRGNQLDKYGTPACPLIMAAYAMEQSKIAPTASYNIYYIGIDNSQNIPNHLVIEKGALLAKDLGCSMEIKNLYVTATNLLKNY